MAAPPPCVNGRSSRGGGRRASGWRGWGWRPSPGSGGARLAARESVGRELRRREGWAVSAPDAVGPASVEPGRARVSSLTSWLARAARDAPGRVLLRDAAGRGAWCDRAEQVLDAATAFERVRRLAGYLRGLGLPAGARVGICLPNGSEACLSLLAVEDAGLTPCLLDVTADPATLSAALDAADIRALITQATVGTERPAEKLCLIAAGFFRLRFILAFGPGVPDGVADLDAILDGGGASDRSAAGAPSGPEPGLITFARVGTGEPVPVFRSRNSLVAVAAATLAAARIRPGDRLASLLAPDDLKGLVTGFVAALLSGAVFEPHPVMDGRALAASADAPGDLHLVAPGWLEGALAGSSLSDKLRSTILVHDAPTRFPDRGALRGHVTDVLALGETALLAGPRRIGRSFGVSLTESSTDTHGLLDVALDDADHLCIRGIAATVSGLPLPVDGPEGDEWRRSGFRAWRAGSRVAGVA